MRIMIMKLFQRTGNDATRPYMILRYRGINSKRDYIYGFGSSGTNSTLFPLLNKVVESGGNADLEQITSRMSDIRRNSMTPIMANSFNMGGIPSETVMRTISKIAVMKTSDDAELLVDIRHGLPIDEVSRKTVQLISSKGVQFLRRVCDRGMEETIAYYEAERIRNAEMVSSSTGVDWRAV